MTTRFVATILLVLFILSNISSPVYSQPESFITHSQNYYADGIINLKKQAGHFCNTGAEMKQTITGEGELIKSVELYLAEGLIQVDDNNSISTKEGALENLAVATALQLCSPPKTYFDYDGGLIHITRYEWNSELLLDDPEWNEYWEDIYDDYWWVYTGPGHPTDINPDWDGLFLETPMGGYYMVRDLTEQIWATSVSANPGHSATLNTDFEAAYDHDIYAGPDYIGDYFYIDQYTYVSDGVTRRLIGLSSPTAHTMLYEDLNVEGFAEIEESLRFENAKPGDNIDVDWWSMLSTENYLFSASDEKERYLSQNVAYTLDGSIDFKKQAGHFCNTGAEMKQTITGEGLLAKSSDIFMVRGLLEVSDENDFVTAVNANNNLTVTSVIELCAPPKQLFDGDVAWLNYFDLNSLDMGLIPYYFSEEYERYGMTWPFDNDEYLLVGPYFPGDVVNPLLPQAGHLGQHYFADFLDNISEQVWAAQVSANPGHRGINNMNFEAAYGLRDYYNNDPSGLVSLWFIEDFYMPTDSWWVSTDGKGLFPVVGSDYVGDYFTIEQFTSTTEGVLNRYIDISSPWSHGYLFEDMTVTGKAEVRETFEMKNLPSGKNAGGNWWNLSGDSYYTPVYDYYLPGLRVDGLSGISTRSLHTLKRDWLFWSLSDNELLPGMSDLLDEVDNWDYVLDELEDAITGFDRNDVPDFDGFKQLPPYILLENYWPYWGFM